MPKIDVAIWLHFETCPAEVDRVVATQPYKMDTVASNALPKQSYPPDWWKPTLLADTILVYEHRKDEYGNGQTLFFNPEKTEGYLVDIWN